ncbi:MAG: hypothetical protein LBE36_13245 [Flavobacteriaceae bacterium]|jgi:Spy/CpxP family protein refolding chaperone|nr:hypothetical protein [Flavobacteriaceae bacterium]
MRKLVLSLLVVGCGTFAMAQTEKATAAASLSASAQSDARMQEKRDAKLQEMKASLGLSDDQVAKISALQDKRKEAMKANHDRKAADMQEKRAAHEEEMKQILTPEQFEKWQKMKEARRSKEAAQSRSTKAGARKAAE